MWNHLIAGGIVSFFNFGIHALVTGIVVDATRHTVVRTDHLHAFIQLTMLLTITMICLMLAHICEIAVWSAYYDLASVTPLGTSPFEFAFENYATLGYGDLLPPRGMRIIGPVTALNGLLLIGWSVAIIFEVLRIAELVGRPTDKDDT
jgi:Ion channel